MTNDNPELAKAKAAHNAMRSRETLETRAVSYEDCHADTKPGTIITPETLKAQKAVITDVGVFEGFLAKYENQELTEEKVKEIYRETIANGVIDHHSIDQFLASRGYGKKRCATQMVFDFADDIRDYVKTNGITGVRTHADSDMDAVASQYLTKSLVEYGTMPEIAADLAKLTNLADYGEMKINGSKEYAMSLRGTLEAIKNSVNKERNAVMREEKNSENPDKQKFYWTVKRVPNPEKAEEFLEIKEVTEAGKIKLAEIEQEYEDRRNAAVFSLFNAVEAARQADPNLDIFYVGEEIRSRLDPMTAELVNRGRPTVESGYETAVQDLEAAQRFVVTVQGKEGNPTNAEVILLARARYPLTCTNIGYGRFPPETIFAVYGGEERKANDQYNIGIRVDQVRNIDLRELCVMLNAKEAELRRAAEAKPEAARTEAETKALARLKEEAAKGRRPMFGQTKEVEEWVAAGRIRPENKLDVDPTVMVSQDSLIAASMSSFMDRETFVSVIHEFTARHPRKS